jgi:RNA polymerase sigma-70 factor (ECF subfamily)
MSLVSHPTALRSTEPLAAKHHAGGPPQTDEARFACFASHGCSQCFRAIFDVYEPLVKQRVRGVLADADETDDLTQDIMIRLLNARAQYDPERPFANWVNRIVTNALKNMIRDRSRRRTVPFSDLPEESRPDLPTRAAGPDKVAEHRDMGRRIRTELRALPHAFRRAFVLHHLEGLTYREAGERLGVQPGTVKTRCFRTCRHLEGQIGLPLRDQIAAAVYTP